LLSSGVFAAPSLIVTEVMSRSGRGDTRDWFELTNFGSSALTITGYRMDDKSAAFGSSVALGGITSIAVGESVVFLATDAPANAVTNFRAFWGANVDSVQIGFYPRSGLGVGLSPRGDAVNIFDSFGNLETAATFGVATDSLSFYYDYGVFSGNSTELSALSSAGLNGAFMSSNVLGDIGSPGAIPEPSTYAALAGVGALGLALLRRRRAAC
jgi:hypothetical protein